MTKKLRRETEKLLRAIEFESVPLSTNKGRFLRNDHCPNKVNSKTRRHKGWVTSRWAVPGKYKEAIEDGLDPVYFYDEWESVKDGIHYDPDRTHIRSAFMSGWSACRNCRPSCVLYETCEQKDSINPIIENNRKLIRFAKIRKVRKEKWRAKHKNVDSPSQYPT